MHYLMLITLTLSVGSTSNDAREEAYSRLIDDQSFCGEGGRFGSPLCDWFVIGDRWSGTLQSAMIGERYKKALSARFPELNDGVSTRWVEERRTQLNRLWRRFGGAGANPLVRNSYETAGFADDAMLVTQPLYDHFLAPYEGESTSCDSISGHFADLDDEPVNEAFVGRKWIVIVDFHS